MANFKEVYACYDPKTGDTKYLNLSDDEISEVQETKGLYCYEIDLGEVVSRTGFWYELCYEWQTAWDKCAPVTTDMN